MAAFFMDYEAFEQAQNSFQAPLVDQYDRAFKQFSNQELVRVFQNCELLRLDQGPVYENDVVLGWHVLTVS